MKPIQIFLLCLLAGIVFAGAQIGGSNGGTTAYRGPVAYKDKESGTIFYVESDGRHVVALDTDAKILWNRNPFVDGKLQPYRTERPVITYIGAPEKEDAERLKTTGSGKFVAISFNSTQFGVLDVKNGDFTFEGQD